MPIDVNELTTRPECEEVVSSLEAELAGYQIQTNNLGLSETRSAHSDASRAKRLADVEADIEFYGYGLAKPDLSPERREEYEIKLRKANDLRDNLTDRRGSQKPAQRVLAAVNAEQSAAQVTVLNNALALVRNRRDSLPA
ncbi:hypothetical protein [Hymenobacter sp. B81]|uniref:hypothetical protein n=1 Tax=Hymenobacter sp. B81 TaxID=3344878 RepID=UPI0037DC273A